VREDYAKSRRVAEAFYRHTRQVVEESSFPVLEVNGAQQRGDTFGVRLANALANAFAAGYERVIAVGSDCPRLHEVDWQEVAGHLDEGTPVLGPTPDRDGTYLIGVTQSQFERQALAALPWKSPALFSALARHLSERARSAPALLEARDDVNNPAELAALVRRRGSLPKGPLARLRAILGPTTHTGRSVASASREHLRRPRSRDPPTVLAG